MRAAAGPSISEPDWVQWGGRVGGHASPVCRDSVSDGTGVILGDHLQGQSTFMCGLLLNGSLVPTISSMWPGPTIPISRMGKQPWSLLEITQAGGAELTPESAPRIESPASNILQHWRAMRRLHSQQTRNKPGWRPRHTTVLGAWVLWRGEWLMPPAWAETEPGIKCSLACRTKPPPSRERAHPHSNTERD